MASVEIITAVLLGLQYASACALYLGVPSRNPEAGLGVFIGITLLLFGLVTVGAWIC